MFEQSTLDIDAETFTEREKLIIRRLGEYRTIDADIRRQERIISGELTNCLPSVTIRPQDDDDAAVMATLRTEQVSENFAYIARVVGERVKLGKGYADRHRVAKHLQNTFSDDAEEDQALQDAYTILTERQDEEPVHLTPAERYASDREREVSVAQKELERLVYLRKCVKFAMEDVKEASLEWWTILHYKYVIGELQAKVQERAAREGIPLTDDEYRLSRKKALKAFSDWVVGLG